MMSIVFTGPLQDTCAALLQQLQPASEAEARYVSPEDVLGPLGHHKAAERIVWVYRAPWALPQVLPDLLKASPSSSDVLGQWLALHRAVLRRRRALGSKLVLVNADAVDEGQLLAHLGLNKATAGGAAFGRKTAFDEFFYGVFEQGAPEYLDVFEALEALAWQSAGTTPPAESANSEVTAKNLHDLYQLMLDGQVTPLLRRAVDDLSGSAQRQAEVIEGLRCELQDCRRDAAAYRAANEKVLAAALESAQSNQDALVQARANANTLLSQLYSVQTELEQVYLSLNQGPVRSQSPESGVARDGAYEASIEESRRLREENEVLLQQMHALQEQLEGCYLENQQMQRAMNQSEEALVRARRLVSRMMTEQA